MKAQEFKLGQEVEVTINSNWKSARGFVVTKSDGGFVNLKSKSIGKDEIYNITIKILSDIPDISLKSAINEGLQKHQHKWDFREDIQSSIVQSVFESIKNKE